MGHYYRLPHAIVITQANGNVRNCNWAYVKDDNTVLPAYNDVSDIDAGIIKVDDLVLPEGEVLTEVVPESVQGEEQAPSSSDSLTMMAESSQPLLQLLEQLKRSLALSNSSTA